MSEHSKTIPLTSSELSVLFGSYMSESLSVRVLSYFLQHVTDQELLSCIQYAMDISENHTKEMETIYTNEGIPIPDGFNENDVNKTAPRLYTDEFILHYVQNIGLMGLNAYNAAIPNVSRKGLREFISNCLEQSLTLFNRCTDLSQQRGTYIRSPYIPYPEKVEYIENNHFLAGWIGEQRPLTSIEISFLFMNMYRNTLASALLAGFAQSAHSKEVKKFMHRGAVIAREHSQTFIDFINQSCLPLPGTSGISATASTDHVFSDKLLMFHTNALYGAGMGFYGASLGNSARKDIAAAYMRLLAEVGEYSVDGAKIMIDNGWMEKPPSAPDRKELAK